MNPEINPEHVNKDGKIICQLCKQGFSKITSTHLIKNHDGMTTKEYHELFPEAPLSNDALKISCSIKQKFDTFKNNIVDLKDQLEIPIIKKDITYEPPKKESQNTDLDDYGPHVHINKASILKLLTRWYPSLINNYTIELFSPSGMLDFLIQTDMADPISKTIFVFPNCIWHNTDIRPNLKKNEILKENRWKIITILSKLPTVEEIKIAANLTIIS